MHINRRVTFGPFRFAALLTAILIFSLAAAGSGYGGIFSYEPQEKKTQETSVPNTVDQQQKQTDGKSLAQTTNDQSEVNQGNLQEDIPGVGAFLGDLLDELLLFSSNSESRFSTLFSSLPLVYSDLYKVFITL